MKRFVGFFVAVVLSACATQNHEPGQMQTAVPSTPLPSPPPSTSTPRPLPSTSTPTLPPPTSTPTPLPATSTLAPTPTVAMSILCPPASSEAEWQCRESSRTTVWTRTCSPAPSSELEWRCYEDVDYGFAISHPESWQVRTPINRTSSDDPAVIVRRHEFSGPEGAVDLDIWLKSESDLVAWLEEMNSISGSRLFPSMEPNATVGGHPAVVHIMDPDSHHSMFTVFFSEGTHIYRLWYTMSCREGGLSTVRRMLDSIRFSPEPIPAEIPDDVWQQALRICE